MNIAVLAITYVLRGTLVTPDQVIPNGVLVVTDGTIAEVGANVTPPQGAPVIDTGGFIYPGLVDLHNHLTWNAHPRWSPGRQFTNRYEWQATDSYTVALSAPQSNRVRDEAQCELQKFAEVKALVWGATTVTGSGRNCTKGLARNADVAADFAVPVQYRVFPFELGEQAEAEVRAALKDGKPVVAHFAEGIDAAAARELRMARAHGFLKPGFIAIHAVPLLARDFKELKDKGVGVVWSPRSNIELYGRTADVVAAKALGVPLAIAPDWSPSGSAGMIAELRYAALWSDAQRSTDPPRDPAFTYTELVRMASSTPAAMARFDNIGQLEKGRLADYVIVRASNRDPYDALIHAAMSDMLLVAVGGMPLFGDAALMTSVNPNAAPEPVTVCGAAKAVDMSNSEGAVSFAKTVESLRAAFAKYQLPMAGLCD